LTDSLAFAGNSAARRALQLVVIFAQLIRYGAYRHGSPVPSAVGYQPCLTSMASRFHRCFVGFNFRQNIAGRDDA
jgi:hypothetical protein